MARKCTIAEVSHFENEQVIISGWLHNKTQKGKLLFLMVRDGSGFIQAVVFKNDVGEELFERVAHLPQESSIIVTGKAVEDKRAKGGFEIQASHVKIIQEAGEFPITPKEHGIDFLMDHRHLWLRSKRQNAILKIRHEVIKACRNFFDTRGFTLIDAPIFTPAACEGTTTLFETNYFDSKAYLTQSGQLYMEAGALAFGKVYCFGPTFRAEKSKTRRHLTEFWMIEPEMAYCDLEEDMNYAEAMLEFVVQTVLENRAAELEIIERDTTPLKEVTKPFPRIKYDEAVEILRNTDIDFQLGSDFGGGDETIISEHFKKPVMITHYPKEVKAFYMKEDAQQPGHALCVDVLAPEGYGEIIGGGQREDDYEILLRKIKSHGLPEEAFRWYLDLRKYGTVPHSGFGLGIERTVSWLCGIQHVRETIPFPRTLARLYP
jgi:asparaginyl-tRNA synthetase